MKALRLVAANILVFLALWMCVVLLIAVVGDVWVFGIKPHVRATDGRAALPPYADHEMAARIFSDQKEADFRYVPFVEWRHRRHSSETVNIDSEGLRMHKAGKASDGAETTIGFFGGSTMWGTGVDDDSTIPAFFDQLTDGYQVTNYAERGYTSRQNLEELINLVVTRRVPKVVVFYNGYNETWAHCNYTITRSLNGHIRESRLADALATAEEDKSALYESFVEPVVRFIIELLGRPKKEDEFACSNDPERADAVAEMIVANWAIAELLVSRNGGRFYAFLQPNAYVGKPRIDYLGLSSDRLERGAEFQAVYPLVRKKLSERGASWAKDLSGAFDSNEPIFIDDAHVAPQGNRIIAEQMRKFIDQSPQLPQP